MTPTPAVYRRLLQYVVPLWPVFLAALIGNLLYSGVDTSFTYILQPLLDKGFIRHDRHFIHHVPWIIIGLFITRGIANIMANYCMGYVARKTVMTLRQELFEHLLRLPARFYDQHATAALLSAIIYDIEQIASASADALSKLTQAGFLAIGLLYVMFTVSWQLSLLYLMAAPLIAIVVKASSLFMRRMSTRVQHSVATVAQIAQEALSGYQVVRTFGGEAFEAEKFKKATQENRRQELKIIVIQSLSTSLVQLLAAVTLAITIALATNPDSLLHLSAGAFVSMIAAMLGILKPIKDITTLNAAIQRGLAGAESLFTLLDEPPEHTDGRLLMTHAQSTGAIVYRDVSFAYPTAHKHVLEAVHLTIESGQQVALVGHSGSGKSTIIKLLLRFYEPAQGAILLGGTSIQHYALQDFRKHFAIVSQHVTLFNDTIANNIAYSTKALVTPDAIHKVAVDAHVMDFATDLPQGLDTMVGENGVQLSGGQRQRIAVARALLKDAPILILDEATSALDTTAERVIQEALATLMRRRTTLIIAHRLSTIERADMIFVLEKGRLVETGTHVMLLQKRGVYAMLHHT